MFKQFIYPIEKITLQTSAGKRLQVGSLADILLVAEAHSNRMGHLNLALRFRTRCDISFMQIDLPAKISMPQYPEGFGPKNPAKAIAKNMRLQIQWNGKDGAEQRASFMVVCGSYTAEDVVQLPISPFLEVVAEKQYTRNDVDDDKICVPPV